MEWLPVLSAVERQPQQTIRRTTMKSKSILLTSAAFCLSLAPVSPGWAGDVPPEGAKPLSEILESVEGQKLGVFSEAEFDDGLWELKVCEANGCRKLYIAPKSGDEIRRRKADSDEIPPANARPLSMIIRSVEAQGSEAVTEIEFVDGFWEVDLRGEGKKTKLIIDPMTGEIK
jgi:hypothetical protein